MPHQLVQAGESPRGELKLQLAPAHEPANAGYLHAIVELAFITALTRNVDTLSCMIIIKS
jgi:hypothetical protein